MAKRRKSIVRKKKIRSKKSKKRLEKKREMLAEKALKFKNKRK